MREGKAELLDTQSLVSDISKSLFFKDLAEETGSSWEVPVGFDGWVRQLGMRIAEAKLQDAPPHVWEKWQLTYERGKAILTTGSTDA